MGCKAVARNSHHLVTRLQIVDTASHHAHNAGTFSPGGQRTPVEIRQLAEGCQNVAKIQAGGGNLDLDFPGNGVFFAEGWVGCCSWFRERFNVPG